MYGIGNKNLTHTICVPPHTFVSERVKLLILGKSRCVCVVLIVAYDGFESTHQRIYHLTSFRFNRSRLVNDHVDMINLLCSLSIFMSKCCASTKTFIRGCCILLVWKAVMQQVDNESL